MVDRTVDAPHRAGVVAILGRPNAGKSTLLNRILGEKLAIVSAKPQTTRSRVLGILSRPDAQLLFVDTPGLHTSERVLNQELNAQVRNAAEDCDVALLLIDLNRGPTPEDRELLALLNARQTQTLLVGTKRDAPGASEASWSLDGVAGFYRLSARTGEGVEALVEAIVGRLPESPSYYPESDLSDRPVRFLVAELVREAAFEELSQELPYAVAVEVVEFDETREDLVRIDARLIVERESQKAMAIGRGGRMVKRIGTRARKEIERFVGKRVHLALQVRVEPKWSKRPGRIRSLGYT